MPSSRRSPRDVPGLSPLVNALGDTQPGYYKFGLQFDAARFGTSRERFLRDACEGIAWDEGFKALHVGRSPSRYRRTARCRKRAGPTRAWSFCTIPCC